MLKVTNDAIVPVLGKRGQLCISTAEQPQAGSAHLQVMLHHRMQVQNCASHPRCFHQQLPVPRSRKQALKEKIFWPTAAHKGKLEAVGERSPDHTKVTRLLPLGRAACGSANLPNFPGVKTPSHMVLPDAGSRLNFPSRGTWDTAGKHLPSKHLKGLGISCPNVLH